MEFNIGDTVTCKKSLKGSDWESPSGRKVVPRRTVPGKKYKITYADYWNEEKTIIIYSVDSYWTLLSSQIDVSRIGYQFEKYFYSKKELRALKIKNIQKL